MPLNDTWIVRKLARAWTDFIDPDPEDDAELLRALCEGELPKPRTISTSVPGPNLAHSPSRRKEVAQLHALLKSARTQSAR